MVPSDGLLEALADAVVTAVGTVHIRLGKNDILPAPGMVIGDFEVATFGGYADVASAATIKLKDELSGDWVVALDVTPAFSADNTITTPQTVYTAFITDNAGAVLFGAVRLEVPYTFSADGDGLILPIQEFRVPMNAVR